MPELATKVSLLLPDHDERNAFASDSIKMNNDKCDGYSDSQNRIFEVVSKKTLKLFPEEMTFSGAKEGNLPEVSLKDKEGIVLFTHADLNIKAKKDIILEAKEIICIASKSIKNQSSKASLEIKKYFNIHSMGE